MNRSILGESRRNQAPGVEDGSALAALARRLALFRPRFAFDATFSDAYHRWNLTHAAAMVVLVLVAQFTLLRPVALALLAVWIVGALGTLFVLGRRLHPDGAGPASANLLTATRGVAAAALIAIVVVTAYVPEAATALRSAGGWYLVGMLLVVELTDLLDGHVARRLNAGAFGATWDMESDAAYALALSLAVRHVHEAPVFVLLIGLLRYLYVLLWHYDREPTVVPRAYKLFAKTTTAILVTTLILALLPPVGDTLRAVSLLVVLGLQLVSFGWDLVLQRSAGERRSALRRDPEARR
ncbi:MAG: CDP-alcohol phosphatidyltransferase family protein [Spirochaetota bacterium]